jgi:hypothetical protein
MPPDDDMTFRIPAGPADASCDLVVDTAAAAEPEIVEMLATGDGAWVVRNSLRLRSAVSRCDEDSARLEDELS